MPTPVRNVRWTDTTAIVEVAGDVDLSVSAAFQQALLQILDKKPKRVIINLQAVPYMDSSGVASLVKMLARARKSEASLRLVGLSDRVRSVFEITRLDGVFEIFATETEASA